MVCEKMRIINRAGIHLRAAQKLSDTAESFRADITLCCGGKDVDAKSVIALISAGIPCNALFEIQCIGEDEEEALSAVKKLIENGFYESEKILKGAGVSPGFGTGKAKIIKSAEAKPSDAVRENERERLTAATDELKRRLKDTEGISREIESAYISILDKTDVFKRIEDGVSAERAVYDAFTKLSKTLEKSDSGVIRLRACEIREIRDRLILILKGREDYKTPDGGIIVMKEPLITVIARLDSKSVDGIVCETGGSASHGAIIARAKGIPAVFSVKNCTKLIIGGDVISVDGDSGEVKTFLDEGEKPQKKPPCKKRAGLKIYANITSAEEAKSALKNGAEGIGLFRTEFLFLNGTGEPSEEEQFSVYAQTAEIMGEKEVIIRALDTGGDKKIPYFSTGKRGAAFLLERRDVFKRQTRAVMRAAAHGNVKYMLPFITGAEEIRAAKVLIEECAAELEGEEKEYKKPPLGVMMETPSAVLISDILAKECDFFSIGTNDLASGISGKKREECAVEDAFCPAVMRAARQCVQSAKEAGIEVGLCGAAAEVEEYASLAEEWGADSISLTF